MIRLLLPSALGLTLTLLWAYCIIDVISTDELRIRNLPKSLWLVIVIFIPTVGSIAWLAAGRQPYAPWQPGGVASGQAPGPRSAYRRPQGPIGPEDRADWEASASKAEQLQRWEEELEQRERDLRRKENGEDPPEHPPMTW